MDKPEYARVLCQIKCGVIIKRMGFIQETQLETRNSDCRLIPIFNSYFLSYAPRASNGNKNND